MRIYLIGMPGCGKSTLGKELGQKSKTRFIDLDHEIEKHAGKNINNIFQEDGEGSFRKIESALLRELSNSYGYFIMSTGGGAPCYFNNMGYMNKSGNTIYLKVSLEELTKRLEKEKTSRPLLATDKPMEQVIKKLLSEREKFYRLASRTLRSDSASIQDLESLLTRN